MNSSKKRNVYNEKEFIELAMNIHNNNFLYENIGYKTYAKNKITIKCHLIDTVEEKKLDPSLSYFSFLNGHKKFKKMTEKKESESKCPFGFK